jgi:hypothetical protein
LTAIGDRTVIARSCNRRLVRFSSSPLQVAPSLAPQFRFFTGSGVDRISSRFESRRARTLVRAPWRVRAETAIDAVSRSIA